MSESSDDLAPWPREGEIWVAARREQIKARDMRLGFREAAAELLIKGVLQFEGDPAISIRRCL